MCFYIVLYCDAYYIADHKSFTSNSDIIVALNVYLADIQILL